MLPAPAQRALSTLTAAVGTPALDDALRARWRAGGRLGDGAARRHARRGPLRSGRSACRRLPLLTHMETASRPSARPLRRSRAPARRGPLFVVHGQRVAARRADGAHPGGRRRRSRPSASASLRWRVIAWSRGRCSMRSRARRSWGRAIELAPPENIEARARLEILIWEAGASAHRGPRTRRVALGFALDLRRDDPDARARHAARPRAGRALPRGERARDAADDRPRARRAHAPGAAAAPAPSRAARVGPCCARAWASDRVVRAARGHAARLGHRRFAAPAATRDDRVRVSPGRSPSLSWDASSSPSSTRPPKRRGRSPRSPPRRPTSSSSAGTSGTASRVAFSRGAAARWRREPSPAVSPRSGVAGRGTATCSATSRGRCAHCARWLAARAPDSLDESRRWIEVIAMTDAVDDAERDPLDLELGLENLMRLAAQYDDEEADARAARFAGSLAPTFQEARRIALGSGRLRQRAAAINALEGCARAFALRLWAPLLATHPGGEALEEPNLAETWNIIARAPAEILDLVKERRQSAGASLDEDVPLEVLAVRLGGYALDACGEDSDLGPGRGPTAHETCLWLRKIEGLADGSRDLPPALKGVLSSLFWRLVDTTRGTALGEVDDVQWLGPFAAWWALVIDRPATLLQLATALPMMAEGALAQCCEQAEALRTAVSLGLADGQWGSSAAEALEALHAGDTELARALVGPLARARSVSPGPPGTSPTSTRCASSWSRRVTGCTARSPIPSRRCIRRSSAARRRLLADRDGERGARRRARRAGDPRARAVDARRLVRVPRARRVGAPRRRRSSGHPSIAAAPAPAQEERAEAHRRLRAGEAARRGRRRLRLARAQAGGRPALRPQDSEGRRPCERQRQRASRRSSRRSSRRPARSPVSTTRTSPTSSTAGSPARCRSSCSST